MIRIIRFIAAVIMLILIVAALFYYRGNNPSDENSGFFLVCWVKAIFDWDCVSCGGQRALHHLLNGNFTQAIRYNGLLVLFSPFLAYLVFEFLRQAIFGVHSKSKILYNKCIGPIAIFLIVAFTILRNLPWHPFTLLAPPN